MPLNRIILEASNWNKCTAEATEYIYLKKSPYWVVVIRSHEIFMALKFDNEGGREPDPSRSCISLVSMFRNEQSADEVCEMQKS